jgi:hypothetical protein
MGEVTSPDVLSHNVLGLEHMQRGFALPSRRDHVRNEDGAWRIYEDGRTVAIHGRDGQREGDRAAEQLLSSDPNTPLVVIVGLGLGFALDGLERRAWSGTVLALEPEPATIPPLLERRDWRAWIDSGRLRILAAPDFVGASDGWKLFGDGASAPPLLVNPALAQIRPAEVKQAQALVNKIRSEARSNHAARQAHAGPYLLHTLRNLSAIASEGDASTLAGIGRGTPAILVAAGPSLDRALPMLRRLQHCALIIAVDTASLALLHAGVTPHLVVAVDPAEHNARHLTDLPACPDTWLVTEGSIDPLAIRAFAGRTFFFCVSDHEPWPWLRSRGRQVATLRAWGSVLTTTFDLALRMECDPIAFVGTDLSFTGDRLYARGVSYEQDWRRRADYGVRREAQWLEAIDQWPRMVAADVNGGETRTAAHLVAFRDWLVEQMRREPNRRFINATGAGILHGAHVTIAPDELPAMVEAPHSDLPALVRAAYRPFDGAALLHAASELSRSARNTDSDPTIARWEAFAPGLARDRMLDALEDGMRSRSDHTAPTSASNDAHTTGAYALVDLDGLQGIARELELVPLSMPAHRMEAGVKGARRYCFRSTAARIITCAVYPPDGAVWENGKPLTRASDHDHIEPGAYVIWRDEVQFRATDDSDPRTNGRHYTVLVPHAIDYIERLPAEEILRRGL